MPPLNIEVAGILAVGLAYSREGGARRLAMERGSEWPLVGRIRELRQLTRLVESRSPRGVVIAGPVGVGKTRLAREALKVAERNGAIVGWVTATRSAAKLPLGAMAPLLPAASGGLPGEADR
ncbi:MAG: ATP-binding protein, partial [Actinobacteria bacterium]|nr:ATP-binding protein [Actinomycetota bacterium]